MRIPLPLAFVFVAACADPLAPPRFGDSDAGVTPPLTTSQPDAVALLHFATTFETPARGLSLSDPPNWVAWREVLLGETAASDFRHLYENAATPEGRMYGAAGILAADPDAGPRLAADPRWAGVEILVVSGCLVTSDPAPMLLRVLASSEMREYFRTGDYPVAGS